jgi:hypothetical protein
LLTRTFRSRASRSFALPSTTSFGSALIAPDGKTSAFWTWPSPKKRIVLTLDKDFWQIAV